MSDTLGLGKLITTPQHRDAIHVAVAPCEAAMDLEPGEHVALRNGFQAIRWNPDGEGVVGIVDPFLRGTVRAGERFWCFLYPGSITSLRHDWVHPAFPEEAPTKQDVIAGLQRHVDRLEQESDQRPERTPASVLSGESWRTPTVLNLCRAMRETKDYSSLPILADALEEAGYADAEVLTTLRRKLRYREEDNLVPSVLAQIESDEGAASVRWIEDFAMELDQTYLRLMEAAQLWEEHDEYTRDDSEQYKFVDYDKWTEFWQHWERVTGQKRKEREYEPTHFFTCSC